MGGQSSLVGHPGFQPFSPLDSPHGGAWGLYTSNTKRHKCSSSAHSPLAVQPLFTSSSAPFDILHWQSKLCLLLFSIPRSTPKPRNINPGYELLVIPRHYLRLVSQRTSKLHRAAPCFYSWYFRFHELHSLVLLQECHSYIRC